MKASTNTVSLLMEVGRIIRSRMERELPLSFAHCETLRLLETQKDASMSMVASHFKITAPSATSMVDGLVKADLVARSQNSEDRREVLLSLTPLGAKKLRTISEIREKVLSDLLSALPENDKHEFDAILTKILNTASSQ